jgi:DNA helicase-2/ATP-dependent DNA helicase PcrA
LDLSPLNPAQRRAVTTTEGPLLVLAGAGSGKTRVITHRMAHLLARGVAARSILAVTFTNKAAAEMKERVVRLAGRDAQALTVCTFHAFGAEILREHIHHLGWPRRFAIADLGDQLALVQRGLRERQLDGRSLDPRRILSGISRAKNTGEVPSPEASTEPGTDEDYALMTAEVFPLYQRGLKAQGAVDFDDLLVLPRRLFGEHPDVLGRYVRRYRYLLVDEFQDTNGAQLELLRLLAGERRNVCAVGDDDQCIYGWRGAEVRNILRFEESFPGATVVRLEQNYRSTGASLTAAHGIVSRLPERRPKQLWTERVGGAAVQLAVLPSEEDEAAWVARTVEERLAAGLSPDEVAVLYRTNGQSRPLEEAFSARGLRHDVVGGSEFFDRREVRDVLAYLKALANPADEVSLLRIVNVPARGIGDVTVSDCSSSPGAASFRSGRSSPRPRRARPPRGRHGRWRLLRAAPAHSARLRTEPPGQVARAPGRDRLRGRGRASGSSATAVDRRLRGVEGVLTSSTSSNGGRATGRICGPTSRRSRWRAARRRTAPDRRVALMTLHAAKGLEFRWLSWLGWRRLPAPRRDAGRAAEPRGGAAPLLRGLHPGQGDADPHPGRGATAPGSGRPPHPLTLPGRHPRRGPGGARHHGPTPWAALGARAELLPGPQGAAGLT